MSIRPLVLSVPVALSSVMPLAENENKGVPGPPRSDGEGPTDSLHAVASSAAPRNPATVVCLDMTPPPPAWRWMMGETREPRPSRQGSGQPKGRIHSSGMQRARCDLLRPVLDAYGPPATLPSTLANSRTQHSMRA